MLILTLGPDELEALQAFQIAGTPHGLSLHERAAIVPLEELCRVQSNERTTEVQLFRERGMLKAGLTNNRFDIDKVQFDSAEERDRFFSSVRARLEPKMKYTRSEWSSLRTFCTLGFLPTFAALVTWAFWRVALDGNYKPGTPKSELGYRLLRPVIELLGPTGVLITGGIITAALLVFVIRKAAEPPIMLKLTLAPKQKRNER
ncbi:hypothetical protein RAS2_18180 [Phycisphaerae bacterium RAS2]|nr:hypothetical protein RAS2_18180 [Phycisphaerae bacterium RAS2]